MACRDVMESASNPLSSCPLKATWPVIASTDLNAVPIGLPGIRDALRCNGATQVVAKHVVLGVIPTGKRQYLGMV